MRIKKGSLLIFSFLLAACFALAIAAEESTKLSRETVRNVQQALKDKGYDPGPVDGIMGPNTRAAIKQFQSDNNLPATGEPDDQTLARLGVEKEPAERLGEAGKEVGRGAKEMGREVKKGRVGEGAKELGKSVGRGAKKAGEAVKDAVTPEPKPGSDADIKQRIKDRFAEDAALKNAKIDIDVKEGIVTLSGNVDASEQRDRALEIARSVTGVKDVVNRINVRR